MGKSMHVLFVFSGNNSRGISPIVENQARSIERLGFKVSFFPIQGSGLLGYIKAIPKLRAHLNSHTYDLLHAHYSLSAYVAGLACRKIPVVCSLMGSDVHVKTFQNKLIPYFAKHLWAKTIVKSDQMKDMLAPLDLLVVPNGVDFDRFLPLEKVACQKQLGWNLNRQHILFAANPDRPVKNFSLAKSAVSDLASDTIDLHWLEDVSNDQIPIHMNAADAVLLTSEREGSPNVIKEAMACSRPIVTTKVGDVEILMKGVQGCAIVENHNQEALVDALNEILSEKLQKTNGREVIEWLSDSIVAQDLLGIYRSTLTKNG